VFDALGALCAPDARDLSILRNQMVAVLYVQSAKDVCDGISGAPPS
jgi:hypothetical protein